MSRANPGLRRTFLAAAIAVAALDVTGALAAGKKKSKKPDETAAAAPAAGADQGSAVLDRALKLYEGKEFEGASIELNKVIEGESGDSPANKQKAEFFMGKTLYNMRFLNASIAYFDRVVEAGAAHPYYSETLKWLASLATDMADPTPVVDRIGKYQRDELEQPALESVRDQLYFLLGRSLYKKGEFTQAIELYNAIPKTSKWYVRAKLFEGATHVREYRGKEASDAFKEVLRATVESDDESVKPFEDLAYLSLARTFYSTGQFALAAKYFDFVSMESYDWANSLFESSWANFMLRSAGYPKALGNIHTLGAPYFENSVKPESVAEAMTVKATIYFYNCQYDKAADAITEFNEKFPQLAQDLNALAKSTDDNSEFYATAVKVLSGKSGQAKNIERAARAVLSDLSLKRKFDYVAQLDAELALFEKADAAWKQTAIANLVYTDLTLQQSLTINEAGELARQRVTRLVAELAGLIKRTIKIEYEILSGQKGTLTQELIEEQQVDKSVTAREVGNVRVDDEHEIWPFDGEYWRDELGYYRVRLKNQCARNAPEGAPTGPTEAL
jgi:tetratricopeptide (TPR) repeat protein